PQSAQGKHRFSGEVDEIRIFGFSTVYPTPFIKARTRDQAAFPILGRIPESRLLKYLLADRVQCPEPYCFGILSRLRPPWDEPPGQGLKFIGAGICDGG